MNHKQVRFRESLPPGPLVETIMQVHAILLYMDSIADVDANALAIAEHNLRAVALFTAVPDFVRHAIREEVMREFGIPEVLGGGQ